MTDAMTDASTDSGTGAAGEPVEEFPPTLREVMLRPAWIGMLLLCLLVAGVFAWLGQWQLGRAIDTDPLPPVPPRRSGRWRRSHSRASTCPSRWSDSASRRPAASFRATS